MFSSSLFLVFRILHRSRVLVDKYERRTTRTASTFVLAYPYGLPRRLFPTPFLLR